MHYNSILFLFLVMRRVGYLIRKLDEKIHKESIFLVKQQKKLHLAFDSLPLSLSR